MALPPAPAADQNATPIYGIRYPKTSSKAMNLGLDFADLATDMETVLANAAMPAVITNTPVVAASASARDAHWGVPTTATQRLALQALGAETIRTDTGIDERYYAALTDGGSNPGGKATAGWYQLGGSTTVDGMLQLTTATSTATGTGVVTTFDATDVYNNLGSDLTITRSSGKIVCAVAGTYEFTMDATFAFNATGVRFVYLQKAVAASPTSFTVDSTVPYTPFSAGSLPMTCLGKWVIPLAVGDVVNVGTNQASGGALNLNRAHLLIKKIA